MTETAKKEYVGFSLGRVWTIALNTFTESVRQKVFNFLLIFGLVAIASASFFSQFTFGEQIKFVKDLCLGALSVFGTLIAIVGTAQMLPSELENRTIYTILSKPVRRFEFLLGKYCGSMLLILMSVVMMSLMVSAALFIKEQHLVRETMEQGVAGDGESVEQAVRQIRAAAHDVDMVKAVLLIVVKLALIAAITLLFSTISTSMVFNVAVALMAFFAGHLRVGAGELWGQSLWVKSLLAVIPDLTAFNVADDVMLGNVIPWGHVMDVAIYGLGRTLIIVVAAHLLFMRREI